MWNFTRQRKTKGRQAGGLSGPFALPNNSWTSPSGERQLAIGAGKLVVPAADRLRGGMDAVTSEARNEAAGGVAGGAF